MIWIFVPGLDSKLLEGIVTGIEYMLQVLVEWANNQQQDSGQVHPHPLRARISHL